MSDIWHDTRPETSPSLSVMRSEDNMKDVWHYWDSQRRGLGKCKKMAPDRDN